MTDVFKKETIRGLRCISGKNTQNHMREYVKNGKDVCDHCIINYNKKKGETCVRLTCEYALDYLKELGADDEELTSALECLACKKHKEQASHYFKYREEECSVCRFGPYEYGKSCIRDVANAALEAIAAVEDKPQLQEALEGRR